MGAPFAACLFLAACSSDGGGGTAGRAGSAGSAGHAGTAGTGGSAGSAGDAGVYDPDSGARSVFSGPTRGSAIALSEDDTLAVAVNRDAGSISVLAITYPDAQPPVLTKKAELDLGTGSEPWQVALSPDGSRAFVVLRKTQELVRIDDLHGTPKIYKRVYVGSEPTALALTPTGAHVYVTSWVDGTVWVVDSASLALEKTLDLNPALLATGLLGDVAARPALAHPRSLAITNDGDGDDADESVLVTEYYAQRTTPEAADGSNADTARVGLVYRVSTYDGSIKTIELLPLADIGFKDQNGNTAGCYPNQLQSVTINGAYAYVTSVCASPRGPIGPSVTTTACTTVTDCASLKLVEPACIIPAAGATQVCADLASTKTTTAPVVSVIDLQASAEAHAATASLNQKWFSLVYEKNKTKDDASRRLPLFANDMAFVPGQNVSYTTANGADAVFRIGHDATGAFKELGTPSVPVINLNPAGIAPETAGGIGPIGIEITHLDHGGRRFGFVANDISHNVSALDFNTQGVAGAPATPAVVETTPLPQKGTPEFNRLRGKKLFNTGLARWSLKGQGWGACQSCHGDGLSDNVTFYFARGPRQSVSLDGSFNSKNPHDQRIFNWTGIFDDVADFEVSNARGVSGGVGAIVLNTDLKTESRIDVVALGHGGLSGAANDLADPKNPLGVATPSVLPDWGDITTYIQNIRSPRAPVASDYDKVALGKDLFAGANCAGCHGNAKWTISDRFYTPSIATNNLLKTTKWTDAVNASGFPKALLPALDPADQNMRFNAPNAQAAGAFDQIVCVLRNVGTFGAAETAVATGGLFPEIRANGAPAQGNQAAGNGYNPPSLLGLNVGAPYLHDGGARSLEALFAEDPEFSVHYRALSPNFLKETGSARAEKVSALVAYLLSIDEDTAPIAAPNLGPNGGSFCALPSGTYE